MVFQHSSGGLKQYHINKESFNIHQAMHEEQRRNRGEFHFEKKYGLSFLSQQERMWTKRAWL
jgi:hypothetical protein